MADPPEDSIFDSDTVYKRLPRTRWQTAAMWVYVAFTAALVVLLFTVLALRIAGWRGTL